MFCVNNIIHFVVNIKVVNENRVVNDFTFTVYVIDEPVIVNIYFNDNLFVNDIFFDHWCIMNEEPVIINGDIYGDVFVN